ncbi:MAG: C2 domain-containing protein [Polyangiales bacterium]
MGDCTPGEHATCACDGSQGVRVCQPSAAWSDCLCLSQCANGEARICTCDRAWGQQFCDRGRWAECACPLWLPHESDGGACPCRVGCCGDGVCRNGNAPDACGPSGQVCARCQAGELCVGQRCSPAPTEGLSLVVVGASLPSYDPTKRGCSTWDCGSGPGTAPDPFVRDARLPFRTVSLPNAYSPEWNEVVATGLTPAQLSEPFVLEVIDDDSPELGADDLIARFEVRLLPAQLVPGRLVFTSATGQSRVSLTLELR